MINLIKPYVSFEEIEFELKEILDSGILTTGKYSKLLPERISEYTGADFSFNTTSATTALAMTMELLKIEKDDEVIVSDFSFPATANVVEQRGAVPVFADVDRNTYNMTSEFLINKINKRTKAVIFVNALGNPTGMHEIESVCKEYSLPLIIDAACALGSSEKDVKVGDIGDMTCFSFHPRKLLTSGEGGAITTSNKAYAEELKIKLMHGAIVENGKWNFVDYGFNYRLPEIQSMMIIKQLLKLDSIVEDRIELQEYYKKELSKVGLIAQQHSSVSVHNMQSVVFTVSENTDRDDLISYLRKNGVESVIGTYCISNCEYYKNKYSDVQENALWLEQNTISLPCYEEVDKEYVVETVISYFQ